MKFENTYVSNFEGAFRGMRNPRESWYKSDSYFGLIDTNYDSELMAIADEWCHYYGYDDFGQNDNSYIEHEEKYIEKLMKEGILKINFVEDIADVAYLGPLDLKLAQQLIKAGPEHRKFLRQIQVSVDITAPLYWY